MSTLTETLADIAALIPRLSWEIMDERQRDDLMEKVVLPRYGDTTADGVTLGPKTWAVILGATEGGIANRVYRLRKAKSGVPRATEPEWQKSERRDAKRVLRAQPDIVTQLDPAEQRRVAAALDEAAARREHDRKQESRAKERDHLGDETVDDLERKEQLQTTEYLLIKARGNLRGFVKQLGELGDDVPQAWRDGCLDWVDDLEGHLSMAKTLLKGDNIDWTAFEEMLEAS